MRRSTVSIWSLVAALGVGTLGALSFAAPPAVADQWGGQPGGSRALTASTILDGSSLAHSYIPAGSTGEATEGLADPDDITHLGGTLFAGFQNGVGPQGQPSADGNQDSTIVAFTTGGRVLGQWDVQGKADGVTADPAADDVIVTVNEDQNSALYVIRPGCSGGSAVTRYSYGGPLPHDGGTDAITIYQGHIFISASAPGTVGDPAPQPQYPAVYSVTLDPTTDVASVTPLFSDESRATVANVGTTFGQTVQLGLTDPDSNEAVPYGAPRFGGDFMLTSQGDLEQIFVSGAGTPAQRLSVLDLSQSVDDTAWTGGPGALFTTDSTHDTVDVVAGTFPIGPVVAVTPCGANSAPATCPGPGYPPNYLGALDPWTGQIRPLDVHGVPYVPQGGLAWLAAQPW
jgi:hypothetical protein